MSEAATCEGCDNCTYIGDGDFICDDTGDVVIVGWVPERLPCSKWSG